MVELTHFSLQPLLSIMVNGHQEFGVLKKPGQVIQKVTFIWI